MTEPKHHRYGDRETRDDSWSDTSPAAVAKAALGIEWENTESAARRVAEYASAQIEDAKCEIYYQKDRALSWNRDALKLQAQLEAANQSAEMLADSVAKARAEGRAEGDKDAADANEQEIKSLIAMDEYLANDNEGE